MHKFLDIVQDQETVYDNLYLNEHKVIIKIPLYNDGDDKPQEIKHEFFDLTRSRLFIPYG